MREEASAKMLKNADSPAGVAVLQRSALNVACVSVKRFAPQIPASTKSHTIPTERFGRQPHAHPGRQAGPTLQWQLTFQCAKLGESPCIAVWPIELHLRDGIVFANRGWIRTEEDLDAFARQDGFRDWSAMVAFWAAEHPGVEVFEGVLIRWQPLAPIAKAAE